MLQLKNNTPFAAQLALFPNQQGVDSLYIVTKATFNIGQQLSLAEEQNEPQAIDEFWSDDPVSSSLKNASDLHIGKPATDIIMLGHAWAPEGNEVQQLDVSLSVGHVNKTIRVFGDRHWDNGMITSASPFSAMPLIYEKAFGGVHEQDGNIVATEVRNPIGCGFCGKRSANEMNGLALPNLEDPQKIIQQFDDVVTPAGFSYISPNWQPRASFAGTYDDNWKKTQAPYLPTDFDLRFFNMAHPDLVYPGYLQGGEPIKINGVHPKGSLAFNLPVVALTADVKIKSRTERALFNLETVLIEPDKLQLSMTWKASFPCDKETLKINEVVLNLVNNLGRKAA